MAKKIEIVRNQIAYLRQQKKGIDLQIQTLLAELPIENPEHSKAESRRIRKKLRNIIKENGKQ